MFSSEEITLHGAGDPQGEDKPASEERSLVPQNKEFSSFSSLVDNLFEEFDEFIKGINQGRLKSGDLFPNEKENIIKRVKAIIITIASFRDHYGAKDLSDGENAFIEKSLQKLKTLLGDAVLFWGFSTEDFDDSIFEGDVEEILDDPRLLGTKESENSEEESFEGWSKKFTKMVKEIREGLKDPEAAKNIVSLGKRIGELDDHLDEGMDDYPDEVYETRERSVERLKEKLEALKSKSNEESWDKVDRNHPKEFVVLHDLITAYKGSLDENEADADIDDEENSVWDPREEFPISGSLDNIIVVLRSLLSDADSVRVVMQEETDGKGRVGRDRDNNITRLYVDPAKEFLRNLEMRVGEITDEKFGEWKENLIDCPKLKKLREEIEKDLLVETTEGSGVYPAGSNPEEIVDKIIELRTEARSEEDHAVSLDDSELEAAKKAYFAKVDGEAQIKIDKLLENAKISDSKKELISFESQSSISILQKKIKFVNEIENRHEFYKLSHHDSEEHRNYNRNDFKELRLVITKQLDEANRLSLLEPSDNPEITIKINEINRGVKKVLDRLERMITPDVDTMTLQEIADEIVSSRMDPFLWKDWKGPSGQPREKEIVNAYIIRGLTPEDFETELEGLTGEAREKKRSELARKEISRITTKVGVQLGALNNALQHENEKASGDRSKLFSEAAERVITRRELLIATTENPTHGKEIKTILNRVVKVASLRRGECVVERGGVEVSILENDIKDGLGGFTEEVLYRHDSLLNFIALQGEKGRTVLSRYIEREFGDFSPEAKDLSQHIFISFDYLTLCLRELQKRTQTRGFNGGTGDKDRVMFSDPVAAAVHRVFRYGGNAEDWSMWILLYQENLEDADFKYGKKEPLTEDAIRRGVKEKDAKSSDWSYPDHAAMAHMQKMMIKHEESSLNSILFTQGMIDKNGNPTGKGVPFAGFCQSPGISTDSIFKLHGNNRRGGEELFLFDGIVDHTGKFRPITEEEEKLLLFKKSELDEDLSPGEQAFVNRMIGDRAAGVDKWRAFLEEVEHSDDFILVDNSELTPFDDEQHIAFRRTPAAEERRVANLVEKFEGKEDVMGIDLYTLAEELGFAQLLEATFKKIGGPKNLLTYSQIMHHSEDGGKGGYLGDFLQTLGRAKMFPGNHLDNYLVPFLTHYCVRLAQVFDKYDTVEERNRLYHSMIEALRASRTGGGLKDYAPELTRVINNLSFKEIERIEDGKVVKIKGVKETPSADFGSPKGIRLEERRIYVDALYVEMYGEKPPSHFLGKSLEKWVSEKIALNPEKDRWKDYLAMVNGKLALNFPLVRSGDLLALKDDDKAGH